jgi:hypothetical protein
MNPLTAALTSVGCIFSGVLLGMALSKKLPDAQLSADSRDAVKLSAGMISLMAALVLGLLVSSAKGNFDTTNAAVTQGGAKVILLDRVLAHYGPETEEVREELGRSVAAMLDVLWPHERPRDSGLDVLERASPMETMLDDIRRLEPRNDAQRALQAQALQLGNEILLSRWVQIEQAQTPLPMAFLGILLFWLTMLYLSFGLIVPRSATVIAVMFIGAVSLATAVFLILEMNSPMEGFIRVSSGPMRKALEHLGQ